MNRSILLAAGLALALLVAGRSLAQTTVTSMVPSNPAPAAPPAPPADEQFDYDVINTANIIGPFTTDPSVLSNLLNAESKKGWRLHSTMGTFLIFERPRH